MIRQRLQQVREDWQALGKVQAQVKADRDREHVIARSEPPAPAPGRSWGMGELTNPNDTTAAPGGW